jgi:carbon storage regulator CsrA
MLVLSRKVNESIVIDGRITVKVLSRSGATIKLGIEAPDDVRVAREELQQRTADHTDGADPLHPCPSESSVVHHPAAG